MKNSRLDYRNKRLCSEARSWTAIQR